MAILDSNQQKRALEAMEAYLAAPKNSAGKTPEQEEAECDRERWSLIEGKLKPLLDSFLGGKIGLTDFKSQIDGINKQHRRWGFAGIKGQMFFNMIVNTAASQEECDQELKAALALPANEEMAKSRIRTFMSYIKRLGDEHVEKGGSKQQRPKSGSTPFFLSYFWQIHDWRKWPVYYTNSAQVMEDMNLWRPTGDLADDYVTFKRIHEELAKLFTDKTGRPFDMYGVEHVFWFHGGDPYESAKAHVKEHEEAEERPAPAAVVDGKLPESYVPPIVAVLPQMAINDPKLSEAAKASGTSLPRAFEKSINAAFTMLGYETKLLGQGEGRVPDGRALDLDNSYAILWDGKVRTDGYSMGTDDRTIREYIMTQSRELKRRRMVRNIYYVIVSSNFLDDHDDMVRTLKMDTDINEVILLEADALVAMVDAKLREPHQVTLGPDGLQRLFSCSGIVKAEDVRNMLA